MTDRGMSFSKGPWLESNMGRQSMVPYAQQNSKLNPKTKSQSLQTAHTMTDSWWRPQTAVWTSSSLRSLQNLTMFPSLGPSLPLLLSLSCSHWYDTSGCLCACCARPADKGRGFQQQTEHLTYYLAPMFWASDAIEIYFYTFLLRKWFVFIVKQRKTEL